MDKDEFGNANADAAASFETQMRTRLRRVTAGSAKIGNPTR